MPGTGPTRRKRLPLGDSQAGYLHKIFERQLLYKLIRSGLITAVSEWNAAVPWIFLSPTSVLWAQPAPWGAHSDNCTFRIRWILFALYVPVFWGPKHKNLLISLGFALIHPELVCGEVKAKSWKTATVRTEASNLPQIERLLTQAFLSWEAPEMFLGLVVWVRIFAQASEAKHCAPVMFRYEIEFDRPIKMFGQEWQNPDRVEINGKSSVDLSDFTCCSLTAER